MTSRKRTTTAYMVLTALLVLVVSGCSITTRTTTSTDGDGNILDKKQSWKITTPLGTLGSIEDEDEPADDQ